MDTYYITYYITYLEDREDSLHIYSIIKTTISDIIHENVLWCENTRFTGTESEWTIEDWKDEISHSVKNCLNVINVITEDEAFLHCI